MYFIVLKFAFLLTAQRKRGGERDRRHILITQILFAHIAVDSTLLSTSLIKAPVTICGFYLNSSYIYLCPKCSVQIVMFEVHRYNMSVCDCQCKEGGRERWRERAR